MKINEIRKNALSRYKKHRGNSWVLALICGLFLGALCLICMISELFVLLLIPFLILPFFFACAVNHIGLNENNELSFSSLFSYFILFFRNPFYSNFSAVKSFLKGLLVELVIGFISTGIIYAVYAQSETFIITMNQIIEQLKDMSITYEQFQTYMEANNNELANFINLTNAVNFLTFAYGFIFFVLREEVTIHFRIKARRVPLAGQIARATIRANAKSFNKYYFALNWPILVLILVGMAGGCILSILVFTNYVICGVIGLAMGLAVSSFYLPFYFANQEAIFDQLQIDITGVSQEYIQEVFARYGVKVDIEEHDTEEEVEGTKKDSDESES